MDDTVNQGAQHETHHVEHHVHHAKASGHNKLHYLFAAIAYLIIALVVFYPLTTHITNTIPGVGGDAYQSLWDLWWVKYALSHSGTPLFFSKFIFWPQGVNLVFQTFAPLTGALAIPLDLISIPFAFDVMFILGFVIAGLAMFLLAEYLTRNRYAAFLAGVIFSFSAWHVAHSLGEIAMVNVGFLPLAVYFFIRMLREKGGKRFYIDSVGLGLSLMLAMTMSNLEVFIISVEVIALILIYFIIGRNTRKHVFDRRFAIGLGIAILVFAVLSSWILIPVVKSLTASGGLSTANYLNTVNGNVAWSDALVSYFIPSYYNGILSGLVQGFWSNSSLNITEGVSYIGFVALALALYALYKDWRNLKTWIALIIIFGWLSFGPYIRIGSGVTGIPGLYFVYKMIPLFNVVREPGRFSLVVEMVIAILAAYGFKTLVDSHKSASKSILGDSLKLGAILVVLVLIESVGLMGVTSGVVLNSTTKVTVPSFYHLLANLSISSSNYSILSLPAFPNQYSPLPELYPAQAMYYSAIAGKGLVGGYPSRSNTTQVLLLENIPLTVQAQQLSEGLNISYPSPVVANLTNMTLFSLFNYNTLFVTVSRPAFGQSANTLLSYMDRVFGSPVYVDNTTVAFQTTNAIGESVCRSFVSYPNLNDWYSVSVQYNGSVQSLWTTQGYGRVIVYAPYTNTSITQCSGAPENINANVSLNAIAGGNTQLKIYEQTSMGSSLDAVVNVTSKLTTYKFQLPLVTGPTGNRLYFATGNQSIAVSQIAFTR